MGAVSQSGGTLADFEELLPDSRVEKLWGQLRRDFPKLPDDFQIATYIEPGGMRRIPGTDRLVMRDDRATFIVVSANPHRRYKGDLLKSFASCLLRDWREEEADAWRFVGKGDPAMKFFRQAVREHLTARKNWSELT